MIAIENIIQGIIVLLVVSVAIGIPTGILFGEDNNLVKTMLGVGGNITEIDKGIIAVHKEAISRNKVAAKITINTKRKSLGFIPITLSSYFNFRFV